MMSSTIKIYAYSACGSCKKALKWLNENNITYQIIDIINNPPNKSLIIEAINQFGSRKPLFNTSGASYRKLGSAYIKNLSDKEAIEELINDSKLIKRPFLISNTGRILVGFKPEHWGTILIK